MRKTNAFWVHIYLYSIVNAGAIFYYLLPDQSAAGRWIVALFVVCSFFFFAAHFHVYSKKNPPLVARLDEYCRKLEGQLQKEIESGQKKTQFIRNAYHEVGSQFWAISVVSNILTNVCHRETISNLDKMLGDLSNGCHNLKLLLSNILDYAKYESGLPETPDYECMDLSRNLCQLIDIAQYGAYEKNITIEYFVSGDIPDRVACDRVKFNQVMTNLINNAIKFSEPDSKIFIALQRDNDRWRITVKDQGRGISPALLPHVFDLYFTTRNGNGIAGLGLGLYVARQMVAALQGEITVKSKENAGSSFIVSLPVLPVEYLSTCKKEY